MLFEKLTLMFLIGLLKLFNGHTERLYVNFLFFASFEICAVSFLNILSAFLSS